MQPIEMKKKKTLEIQSAISGFIDTCGFITENGEQKPHLIIGL